MDFCLTLAVSNKDELFELKLPPMITGCHWWYDHQTFSGSRTGLILWIENCLVCGGPWCAFHWCWACYCYGCVCRQYEARCLCSCTHVLDCQISVELQLGGLGLVLCAEIHIPSCLPQPPAERKYGMEMVAARWPPGDDNTGVVAADQSGWLLRRVGRQRAMVHTPSI